MEKNMNFKKYLIALIILVVAVAAMLLTYLQFKPEPVVGAKELTIEVIVPEETNQEFTLHTDAEYLRQALEEVNLIKGSESEYGLFLTEVNGRIADQTKQEWWCITKDNAQINNGVDTIVIANGNHYEITLKTGY
jgi:hypothetical protein